jgi:hypothetical protein
MIYRISNQEAYGYVGEDQEELLGEHSVNIVFQNSLRTERRIRKF